MVMSQEAAGAVFTLIVASVNEATGDDNWTRETANPAAQAKP